MMYPFLTLDDDTEITHSEMQNDGTVKVYVEKPVEGGFQNAWCILPGYRWEKDQWLFGHRDRKVSKDNRVNGIIKARSEEVIEKWLEQFNEIRYFC